MEKLTIFTPTYNRAETLKRTYLSLVSQTSKDFVWLIVDDGSVDNTRAVVDDWIKENKIKIRYIYQENAGKMQAHNVGVRECETDLFLCLDSDDYLLDNCVEELLKEISSECDNKQCAGLLFLKGKNDKESLSGTEFKLAYSTLTNVYRQGFQGDLGILFFTRIIKQYSFPKFLNEKFITEDYIYCQIDVKYQYKIYNKILMVCEYLNDGYSAQQINLFFKNPEGYVEYYNLKVKVTKGLFYKFKYSVALVMSCFSAKKKGLRIAHNKFLYFFAYGFGFVYYCIRKRKYKKQIKV